MNDLAAKDCVPCRGGIPPLNDTEIEPLIAQLPGWNVEERASPKFGSVKYLTREYRFTNFAEAMNAANAVAKIAEEQQHHPDLHVAWGRLGVEMWTHKIGGLTESDFVFAAKCDAVLT